VERRDEGLSVMIPTEIAGLSTGTLPTVRQEMKYRDKTEQLNFLTIAREVSIPKHLDVMPKQAESMPKHEYLMF
jgi:hypothetical protein